MEEIDVHKPMAWRDFKRMPEELQKIHLQFLISEFDMRSPQIADYFEIAQQTACGWMKRLDVRQKIGRHTWPVETEEQFRRWQRGE